MLRITLERVTGWPSRSWRFTTDDRGKPLARSSDGDFAGDVGLSHSRDMAACAVSTEGPVGIDVEYCDAGRRLEAIAAAAFGPAERLAVAAGGRQVFYPAWTLREALAKATGRGWPLLVDGRDYVAPAASDRPWRASIDERNWLFASLTLPGPPTCYPWQPSPPSTRS